MPRDAQGGFHVSGLRPAKDGKLPASKSAPKEESKPESKSEQGHTEVHNHGDGTFHTVHNGEQTDHDSIGHMHAHLSKIHGGAGEKHFHAHHDGFSGHSHAVETGGEPDHRDGDTEGMQQHMSESMGSEPSTEDYVNEGGEGEDSGLGIGFRG